MSARTIRSIALMLALLSTGTVRAEGPAERPAGERPRLADYNDPEQFVHDVLAWERHQRKTQNGQARHASNHDNESRDWHDIRGPEKLDEALRKAYGYTPPDYEARYRFNRTTHLSFPLPRLKSSQMSGQAITGALRAEDLDERSLKPLPELRTILNETGEQDEAVATTPRGQQTQAGEPAARPHSVRLRVR